MKERYQLQRFNYSFIYEGNDQVVNFVSPEAIQVISGYITRSEPFSISTLSSTTWYSGTYTPIKSINDLKVVSKNNARTFCNILSNPIVINSTNTELKKNNLAKIMKTYGFACDQNLNLI
jgi:hypothetical protein